MFDKKAYHEEYRRTHKEEAKSYDREYRKTHKEKAKAYHKEYRRTHKEKAKAYDKKYERTHREDRKEYWKTHKEEKKEYARTHKEEANKRNRRYYETLKGKAAHILGDLNKRKRLALTPTFLRVTSKDIKELLQKAVFCPHCRKVFSEYLFIKKSLDHILPISKGGLDIKSNCQILCLTCNKSKNDKLESEVN